MHRVQEGPASQSYGIQVAKLAGIPENVIKQARVKLKELEASSVAAKNSEKTIESNNQAETRPLPVDTQVMANGSVEHSPTPKQEPAQADLFATDLHPVVDAITSLDLDNMTPKQALDWLFECKKRV